MRKKSVLSIFLVILIGITGCASNMTKSVSSNLYKEDKNLVFFGVLSLPSELDKKNIWIEKGPIIMAPNLAYRVIDKKELEFIGTDKKPYDFFKSALNKPGDNIEELFVSGFGEIDNKSHHVVDSVEIYVIKMKGNVKIYILSPLLGFVVEVTSKVNSTELIKNIISKTHLK